MRKPQTAFPRASESNQRLDALLKPADVTLLSSAQEAALAVLMNGKLQKEAAAAAAVAPETVCRWLANDAGFVAELNRRRAELWTSQHDRMRQLRDKALDALEELVDSPNPKVRLAAIALIFASAPPGGSGPTTPAGVEKQWLLERTNDTISALDLMLF